MSCECENRRLGAERERIYRIAKAWAAAENITVALYKNEDGTYGFASVHDCDSKQIEEFISPY